MYRHTRYDSGYHTGIRRFDLNQVSGLFAAENYFRGNRSARTHILKYIAFLLLRQYNGMPNGFAVLVFHPIHRPPGD